MEDSALSARSPINEKIPYPDHQPLSPQSQLPILDCNNLRSLGNQAQDGLGDSGLIRRHTISEGIIAKDPEESDLILSTRAESAPNIGSGAVRTSWISKPTFRNKLAMPPGKFIQAAFSPSGKTIALLSDKQLIVQPLEEILEAQSPNLRIRHQLTKSTSALRLAYGIEKLLSVDLNDEFILLRGVGQVKDSP